MIQLSCQLGERKAADRAGSLSLLCIEQASPVNLII